MKNLNDILVRMQTLLTELEAVLTEEIKQLSRLQINPVSLQVVSDNKSRLLSAINFYDRQRKEEERISYVKAPYIKEHALATLWDKITRSVKHANELNQKSFRLFEIHMHKINELKKVLNQPGITLALYNENGQTNSKNSGNNYNISI
ncbi:flagellar export chaperone FlgN [Enterobacter pasteurii]|uniref:flagella synthesis protein FlgN n=1 Tax=Enterobacter pasteurii TaxID=3029761 RepID=UPI0011DDCC12|nr:flagellar export chaperone FlgN [Enterobacter pasteurii]QLA68119.1 flagellar export chaperone FlgN [Enterobacter pasteurii]